jgi:hypothetical protein
MKVMIFAAIMLSVCLLSAQDAQVSPDISAGKEKLMRSLRLTDSAFGLILGARHDTTRATIYYSEVSTLARMQSYVLADDGLGHIMFYNPSNIKGYIIVLPDDTLKFISVENNLDIVSVLSQGLKQEQYVQGTKIFLQCIVEGGCRLFKYNGGTGSGSAHSARTGQTSYGDGNGVVGDDYTTAKMTTKVGYCIQKDNGHLIHLDATSIAGTFSGCAEVADMATKETLKDEAQLKRLITKYNNWRTSFNANQKY